MQTSRFNRRDFLAAGALSLLALGTSACGSSAGTTTGSKASASAASSSSASTVTSTSGSEDSPDLATLVSEVKGKFQQFVYEDSQTGESLPYNLYVPADYDASKSYPLVLYIADSSLVGQDVTAPLSQYGALIWASTSEQAKHESIVLVPEYPSVIIDDNAGHTTTEYVEMTTRLLSSVKSKYSVDAKRVYGTGQSMGCMTVIYLAAEHPDLFTAELFVSGQWDVTKLANLAKEKFFYIAAGGDSKASGGQTDVEKMLKSAGVSYQTATWDATWPASKFSSAAADLFSAGDSINFATFATGTVLNAGGTSSSSMGGEHMASFEPAYKITALRDWLFKQST